MGHSNAIYASLGGNFDQCLLCIASSNFRLHHFGSREFLRAMAVKGPFDITCHANLNLPDPPHSNTTTYWCEQPTH